jgi:hypothetical protein
VWQRLALLAPLCLWSEPFHFPFHSHCAHLIRIVHAHTVTLVVTWIPDDFFSIDPVSSIQVRIKNRPFFSRGVLYKEIKTAARNSLLCCYMLSHSAISDTSGPKFFLFVGPHLKASVIFSRANCLLESYADCTVRSTRLATHRTEHPACPMTMLQLTSCMQQVRTQQHIHCHEEQSA